MVGFFDTVHDITIIAGFHPHLKRITIVTIIPRLEHVFLADVFAVYRVNDYKTWTKEFQCKIPDNLQIVYSFVPPGTDELDAKSVTSSTVFRQTPIH